MSAVSSSARGSGEQRLFDAFIEVFTRDRVLKIQYDTPYVKGLPITLSVREADADVAGSYQERLVRPTYADAYTAEFEALAQAIVEGKELKSGPQDAIQDVDIWEMMLAHLN
ncbi:hypothetical protein FA09DRAFT_325203 [Tilletiopsis washingtonensis]|uniref:Uncharacterized protein n=1 Tax=Tilletiopsis washingtonensis TaxID=58919 RepID=A0A316ZC55_9BASI|nr:hypothetical protein FA09DRAFT_325203 [Tilletiopsis washingtonensis]PWN98896.1 hypothetical protein FA09DRAFT_325203 [Tilletiopsis washingtonensis]